MDAILMFLKPIAEFLISKFPILGSVGANVLATLMAVGLAIELFEAIAKLTVSTKDDEAAAKAKALIAKIMAVLEMIPHVNVPVLGIWATASKWIKKLAGALKGWNDSK